MRIRRRFPPSSLPSADPQLNRSSLVVQLQPQMRELPLGNLHVQECKINSQPSDPPNQPSDQKMMIPLPEEKGRQWVSRANSTESKMKQKGFDGEQIKDDSWVVEEKISSNDIMRKECTLNAEVDIALLPSSSSSSSSSDQDGGWGEGDKVIPLKKRKRSFERIKTDIDKTVKAKWKSKTNKKCLQQQKGDKLKEKSTVEDAIDNGDSTKNKKKRRGSVIMEGSRCSRVNGRGWRCCQQTLVGYSLCEHHLGKGRLRSISSVRNRAVAPYNTAIAPEEDDHVESQASLSSVEIQEKNKSLLMDDDEDSDIDETPRVLVTKKKRKIGMVKARSMSSLLGQMDNAIAHHVLPNNFKSN